MKRFTGKIRRAAAAVLAAVLVSGAAAAGAGSVQAEAATLPQPILGIDVSAYQGDIDWTQVRASGITYAMVRVGNVAYGLDNKFAQNVINATLAGVRVGCYVYTYAKTAEEAAQDAQFAVAAMQQFPVTFPVALDLEDPSLKDLSKQTLADIANTFCSIVYEAGYTPLVYSYKNWLVDKMRPATYDHWVAQFAAATDYPYPYTIWQYSSKGKVPGIAGNVDMDLLFKDYFSSIVPNGTVQDGDITYTYSNWKRMNGFRYVNGVRYFYDVNGNQVKDQTWHDSDGDIVRVCRDGHVVEVTAAAQLYAQTQQKALAAAQAAYDKAAAAQPAAQQSLDQANAQLPALQQKAQSDADAMNTIAVAATADPTNTDLITQLAAAQQQAQTSAQAVADAQANIQKLQNSVNNVAAKLQALQAQQQETAIAQAAVVVPE